MLFGVCLQHVDWPRLVGHPITLYASRPLVVPRREQHKQVGEVGFIEI